MDYPIKTLNQLRPILQGFRKASGLTQAMMAAQLGVTQQTYAQLEANPAAVSVERLFRVLRLLDADLTLAHSGGAAAGSAQEESAETTVRANKTSPLTGAARKSSAGKNPEVQRSTTKTARSSKKRQDW